jgi:hypothetical protein
LSCWRLTLSATGAPPAPDVTPTAGRPECGRAPVRRAATARPLSCVRAEARGSRSLLAKPSERATE